MATAPDDMQTQLTADQDVARQATDSLLQTTQDFNPPDSQQPQFNMPEPQNHFKDIVGLSPLIMALGAVGGVFGRAHGIAMLASTNAMMKGMVTGADDQYKDARAQYDNKYAQFRDQWKTWQDTYKAYMTAYKGRVDAQARAVQGANAAVGIDQKNLKMSQQQVDQTKLIAAKIDELHHKMTKEDSDGVSNRIKADSQASRADTASKEAALKVEQINNQTKTADANTLTATSRSLKSEADAILKQYPASAGKRPPEVDAKLKGIRDSMDIVNERLQSHTEADYNKNKGLYDEARSAIARGADPAAVKKQLAGMGLDPEKL